MGKASSLIVGLSMALTLISTGHAQAPALAPLDATARGEVVKDVATTLRSRYPLPDLAETASARIEGQLASGAYDRITDPEAFAARLFEDVNGVIHDLHFSLFVAGLPTRAGRPPLPSNEAGIVRVDRLAGNVGYIETADFPALETFKPAIDRAMAALADTRALIIDERRNGGGNQQSAAYLTSFFVANDKPVLIETWFTSVAPAPGSAARPSFTSTEMRTSPTPTKYVGKPIYVLTSGATFSMGEGFAYNLQALKLAKVVGQVTRGGAHGAGAANLSHGFRMGVPSSRSENALTHTDWEGRGAVPDIAAPGDEALRVALQQLGEAPQAAGIETLSQASLWDIRRTPLAGTEAAARQLVAGFMSGEPNYEMLSDTQAQRTKGQLAATHALFVSLGALKSVTFYGADKGPIDTFEMMFENGTLYLALSLGADGRVNQWNYLRL